MNVDTGSSRADALKGNYELVIVGGGFHGACAFEDASSRGIKALLLERNDFCSGASANSLKTVHGGIRFLQKGDLRRMRASARAQRLWAQRAPQFLRPLACVAPLPRSLTTSAPVVAAGALLYRLLTADLGFGVSRELQLASPKVVSGNRYRELAGPFADGSAKWGLQWQDYQLIDSERLVMALIQAGRRTGGVALNYVDVSRSDYRGQNAKKIVATDRLTGRTSGIDSDRVLAFAGSAPGDSEFSDAGTADRSWPVLAVNLIVKRELVQIAAAFASGDGARRLFAVPWRRQTIIGTWYRRAQDSATPVAPASDLIGVDELLGDINRVLDDRPIELSEIARVHWGWLPGRHDWDGDAEAGLLRDPLFSQELTFNSTSLQVVEGTKFTSANLLAAERLDDQFRARGRVVAEALHEPMTPEQRHALISSAASRAISKDVVDRLIARFGPAAEQVVEIARSAADLAEPLAGQSASLKAEVVHAVESELAVNLADVIFRRLDDGGGGIPSVDTVRSCAVLMAELLGWSAAHTEQQIQTVLGQPVGGRWIQV